MMVTLLQNVLEDISIENRDKFIELDFIDMIKEKMPGWEIEVWDGDEATGGYEDGLTGAVADYIIGEVEEGRTNLQHCSWTTNNGDTYYYVVASRKD